MIAKTPLAFLSYAHTDDAHENGKLRLFADRLSGEVRLQCGEEFLIFVDRKDLKWGQEWEQRIEHSLDGAAFLIPILTPGYLKSEACRKEFSRFLKREKDLKRTDLILPVYYVRCPTLEDEAKRATDEVARVLHERQYKDWRPYRHEPWTTPDVGRMFEQMALEIVDALERDGLTAFVHRPITPVAEPESPVGGQNEPATEKEITPHEPRTVVVDERRGGDYVKIGAAIRKEKAGTRILVRPGHYREGLVIKKPLEIVGDGNRDDIVVEASGSSVVAFKASMGRLANLTLRQAGGNYAAVHIAQGRLDLEECDISGRGNAGVAILGGAEPRVRRNRIHDCQQSGIFVYDNGAGLIEDNEIFGNALAGVSITAGGNPTVRWNRIYDGKTCGVFAYEKGAGLIEDNIIVSNALSGILVTGADLIVRGNQIRGNREGVMVRSRGRGTFENNILTENKTGAWDIGANCESNVRRSGNVES